MGETQKLKKDLLIQKFEQNMQKVKQTAKNLEQKRGILRDQIMALDVEIDKLIYNFERSMDEKTSENAEQIKKDLNTKFNKLLKLKMETFKVDQKEEKLAQNKEIYRIITGAAIARIKE